MRSTEGIRALRVALMRKSTGRPWPAPNKWSGGRRGSSMAVSLGSERRAVQEPLIRYAVEIGWAYLPPEEALSLRRGEGGTLLYPVLREKLIALNPGIVSVGNVDAVIGRLEGVRNHIEGNAEVLAWLRGGGWGYAEGAGRA